MIHYRRTQISWPTVIPLVAVMLILTVMFVAIGLVPGLPLVAAVLTLILLLFATLTVLVDDSAIEARFGVGAIRKRVPFERIRGFGIVRNPWYYGWGIHFIPGAMLFNASGLSAIELQLTNGRYVRIGTGEPQALSAALRRAAPAVADRIEPAPRSMVHLVVGMAIAAAGLAIAAFVIAVGMQPPEVRATADSFSVRSGLYGNTVPLRRIESLSLEDKIPRVGLRTNGFAAGDTLRGSFRVDTWGSARLYVNLNHPPFVVMRTDDGFVAVNFADPERTREVYAELRQALDRSQ